MVCYHPIKAMERVDMSTGAKFIDFHSYAGIPGSSIPGFLRSLTLPCGKCSGCLLERSRQWALRIMNEVQFYKEEYGLPSCFITLTYSPEHLPIGDGGVPTLYKKDLQDFWKRLRKKFSEVKIKYYACGEYGSRRQRPHYHAIIFGIDFSSDKQHLFFNRCGQSIAYSDVLAKLWNRGLVSVANVSFECAAYVARYCLKKLSSVSIPGRVPEFNCMSLKPAIGYEWYQKYKKSVYSSDSIIAYKSNGTPILSKPPRYYDKLYDLECPAEFDLIKSKRVVNVDQDLDYYKLKRRENYKNYLLEKRLVRNFESEDL